MRILITGGRGQLGRELQQTLSALAAGLGIVLRPWQEALQEYFLTAPARAGR